MSSSNLYRKITGTKSQASPSRSRAGQKDKKPGDEGRFSFCYHCMKQGHFPRDCPAKAAREEERKKRLATLLGENLGRRPPQPQSQPPKDKKKKPKKSKRKIRPVEVPEGPSEKDVKVGDIVFSSMVNNNALLKAVYSGNADETIRHIRRGADINCIDTNGLSPLHIAATHGHNLCVQALLKYQADPNLADRVQSRNPIQLAAMFNHIPCIKSLLLGGADPTRVNSAGESAIDRAKSASARFIMEEYWKSKVIPEYV